MEALENIIGYGVACYIMLMFWVIIAGLFGAAAYWLYELLILPLYRRKQIRKTRC